MEQKGYKIIRDVNERKNSIALDIKNKSSDEIATYIHDQVSKYKPLIPERMQMYIQFNIDPNNKTQLLWSVELFGGSCDMSIEIICKK